MGGCYSRSYSYSGSSRRSYDSASSVKSKLREFFDTKNAELLIEAHRAYENLGKKNGFFKFLMDYKEIDEAPKEFSDTEIESKLEIILANTNKKYKNEPKPTKILDILEFPPTKSARYIKDAVNTVAEGENAFFGTDAGDERFVVVQKGENWYLKEKGPVQHYNFNIPGSQIVLKRKETRVPTDPLQVAQTIMAKYGDSGVKYQGVIKKIKADAFLMNTLTGRMYGMTLTDSKIEDRRQMQLELEYAGYIPGFDIDLDNERSIVEDMVNLNKHILLLYNDIKIESGWKIRFAPTCERKYDFVLGKQLPESEQLQLENILTTPEEELVAAK